MDGNVKKKGTDPGSVLKRRELAILHRKHEFFKKCNSLRFSSEPLYRLAWESRFRKDFPSIKSEIICCVDIIIGSQDVYYEAAR